MTRRKDGLWQEQMTVTEAGCKKVKYFYGHTKREVLEKIAVYQAVGQNGLLLTDAADLWLAVKEPNVTPKTVEGYQAPVNRIKTQFKGMYAKDITPAQVKAFIDGLAGEGWKRTVVQRSLNVLSMIFDYVITSSGSVISSNPCTSVKLPSGLKQGSRGLAAPEDIAKIKASAHIDFGLFPLIMIYTGLRDAEVLALTDADFSDTCITVTKALTWRPNKPVIKTPKTDAGIRVMPLLDPLKAVLPKSWSGYLFSPDEGKNPLSNTQFRHRWHMYCREAGLADPHVTTHKSRGENNREYTTTKWTYHLVPYQLRHEFATICLDAGLDPKDLQDLMGHASPITAQKIYAHIRESRREKSAEKLSKYVNSMQDNHQTLANG